MCLDRVQDWLNPGESSVSTQKVCKHLVLKSMYALPGSPLQSRVARGRRSPSESGLVLLLWMWLKFKLADPSSVPETTDPGRVPGT